MINVKYAFTGSNHMVRLSAQDDVKSFKILASSSVTIPANFKFCDATLQFPEGLGAAAISQTDNLDVNHFGLLLSWWEGEKVILRCPEQMSHKETFLFNVFNLGRWSLSVTDPETLTMYIWSRYEIELDSNWTYKQVKLGDMLLYITKEISLEELDLRAEILEQEHQDAVTVAQLEIDKDMLKERIENLETNIEVHKENTRDVVAAFKEFYSKFLQLRDDHLLDPSWGKKVKAEPVRDEISRILSEAPAYAQPHLE